MSFVEVKPLPLKKWHLKTGKEDFTQPKTREVLYSEEVGGYATGLTPEEAAEYGKILGVDLSNIYDPNNPHPYWTSKGAWLVLPNFTKIFNTEKPADFVKVKNLKASKYVANSLKEWEDGQFPDATHYISDEAEEMDIKATKIQRKQEAIEKLMKVSNEGKIAIIRILSGKSAKGKSDSFIAVEMDALVNEKAEEIIKHIDMGREETTLRANVLEALSRNILRKEGVAIYYMSEMIAADYEDAIRYFKNPNNQVLKISILEKLNK